MLLICSFGRKIIVIIMILILLSYCRMLCYNKSLCGKVLSFVKIVELVVVRFDIVLKKVLINCVLVVFKINGNVLKMGRVS